MSQQHRLIFPEADSTSESGNKKTEKEEGNKVKLLEEGKMKFVKSHAADNNERKENSKDIGTKTKKQVKRGGIRSQKEKKKGGDALSLILGKRIEKCNKESIEEYKDYNTSQQTYKRFKTDDESIGCLSMSCASICYCPDEIFIAPLNNQEKDSTNSVIEPLFPEESFQSLFTFRDQDDNFENED